MTESVPAQTVAGAWVEAWLSVPRFARYLSDISGGRDRALAERERYLAWAVASGVGTDRRVEIGGQVGSKPRWRGLAETDSAPAPAG